MNNENENLDAQSNISWEYWPWVWQTYLIISPLKYTCNKCNCEWKDKGTFEDHIVITSLPLTTKKYLSDALCRGGGVNYN